MSGEVGVRRSARSVAAAVALAVAAATLPLLLSGPGASGATPSGCTPAEVTLSAAVDQAMFTAGTLVRVTVALHNHSPAACSFATGPFSPSFTVTNSAGVTVWGSCWFGGGPAPCAYYLIQRTLAPGATYRERFTWDQRTGHPDLPVPAGRYHLSVTFTGVALRAATSFVLARSRTVTVTVADSGRHYALTVGDLLSVRLVASPLVWTSAVSSNPPVLSALPEMNPVAGLSVFRARAPGAARVTAIGTPACYPQCLMPSRQFLITVSVRSS